jgi:hypothetical protein
MTATHPLDSDDVDIADHSSPSTNGSGCGY